MEPLLNAVEVRALASLVEKESTTPDTYPLTVNALTAACNQLSNRDPVMDLDEATVMDAVQSLIRKGFAREVHRSDSRAKRYRQTLSEKLSLHPPEMAVLCVLMLRGPQTSGEIRTRAARLFDFVQVAQVEITLQSLITLSDPLVRQLPRQPGQKEVRYAHLLAGEPEAPLTVPEVAAQPKQQRIDALEDEVARLRTELADLRDRFEEFRKQFQ